MLSCSVVLATYNGEEYILKQLQSIVDQSHLVDEVIICDDCSKDNTVNIINDFVSKNNLKNWKIIINNNNIGFKNNFKKCISKCKGDIIFLCDQDDIWENNKVETILTIFSKYKYCTSVVTNFRLINDEDKYIYSNVEGDNPWFYNKEEHSIIGNDIYIVGLSEILNHNVAPGCTQAFSSKLIPDFLKASYDCPHDYKINIISSLLGETLYIDKPLTRYRVHEGNTIGIPYFVKIKREKKYFLLIKCYIVFLIELITGKYNNSIKYDVAEKLDFLDKIEKKIEIKEEYFLWKEFAMNRTKIYGNEKRKLVYYNKQKKEYKKFYKSITNTGFLFEKFKIRCFDLFAIFLKKKVECSNNEET